jgi:pimeloyl-ACP methyl ester carboxylesterase
MTSATHATADRDEFSFLPSDAAAVGASEPLPSVERVALTAGVSALSWARKPARIVLAHGAALNAHTWDSTLLSWQQAHGRREAGFLAIDLPGHGDSAWLEDGNYDPARLAPLVADAFECAIADGLLADDFALVGHSLGGLVGLELLRSGPVRFSRLVLVDILPLPPAAASTVASFLDGPASFGSRQEIIDRALAYGFGGGLAALERGVILNTRLTADGRVVWKHHLGVLGGRGLPLADPETLWPVIATAPVRLDLVAATASFIDGTTRDRFVALRPEGNALRVTGGHNLQEDAPIELAAVLSRLLDGSANTSEHP